jgi:putative hydrolase of the HAD superfamily
MDAKPQDFQPGAQKVSNFDEVDVWLFDLDNTLYPAHCDLFAQIDVLINRYVARRLDLALDEARVVQKRYFRKYGTTLRGLMIDHDVDPHDYMDFVHDIDLAPVAPAPDLGAALDRLPGRKLIFTNGSRRHAVNVCTKLGVIDRFEAIFDIADGDFVPKPALESYRRLISRHRLEPAKTVFFDDMDRNLAPAAELGMTTVWVPGHAEWSGDGDGAHVHHVADDLLGFLLATLKSLKRD